MGEKLTGPQRELLREMAAGADLVADILGGYPYLNKSDKAFAFKQQTVAACERRGWIERGARQQETVVSPNFHYLITTAGRQAIESQGERS